jgi:chemotaxis-related protein WspD
MTTPPLNLNAQQLQQTVEAPCWQSIGIFGDRSCPQLEKYLHCRDCPVYQSAGWKLLDHQPPENYLEDWSTRLQQPQDSGLSCGSPMVMFRVAQEWLVMPVQQINEIANIRAIHTIPHRSNSILLGLANIRGELPLCIAMHRLLNSSDEQNEEKIARVSRLIAEDCPEEYSSYGRFLVVRLSSGLWALWVDEVHSVVRIETQKVEAIPSTLKRNTQSILTGVYPLDGKSIGIIDEEKLAHQLLKVLT